MFTHVSRLLVGGVLLFGALSVWADVWSFRSDSWCPYNCSPEDRDPGYLVEILQGAVRVNGHVLDYQLLPYSRALKMAQDGKITGIVGMLALDRKGFIFSKQMGVDSNCLFVNKGSRLKYRQPADFDALAPIGIIQGYGYPEEFQQWSARHPKRVQAIAGEEVLVRQTQKLQSRRLGAFIENENVVRYSSSKLTELKNVELAGCMPGGDPLFIGFSTQNPKAAEIKVQVDAYLDAIRKSGELTRLLDKYRVTPWK